MEEIRVSSLIQASPNAIYGAWLDERKHSAFTGSRATVEPWVGGRHTAWDGYIEGVLVELDTGRRIVMTWRSTEFPAEAPDSSLEVCLDPVAGGTKVTIVHTQIPDGQADQYKQGWRSHYLDPMKRFFGKPGAMKAAVRAASRAGRLPRPGVTSARPGTVRPKLRPAKTETTKAKKTSPKRAAAKRAGTITPRKKVAKPSAKKSLAKKKPAKNARKAPTGKKPAKKKR